MSAKRSGSSGPRRCAAIGRWCLLAAALLVMARPARAQRPFTATGAQALTFGLVFPGVSTVVPRTDAVRAGRFEIRGTKNLQVRFDFALPAALTDASGQSMPLVFSAGDGGYATTATIGSAIAFDPRVPLLARLSNQGRLYIWLGGTVMPSPQQRAGSYSATVMMTMAYTGL